MQDETVGLDEAVEKQNQEKAHLKSEPVSLKNAQASSLGKISRKKIHPLAETAWGCCFDN